MTMIPPRNTIRKVKLAAFIVGRVVGLSFLYLLAIFVICCVLFLPLFVVMAATHEDYKKPPVVPATLITSAAAFISAAWCLQAERVRFPAIGLWLRKDLVRHWLIGFGLGFACILALVGFLTVFGYSEMHVANVVARPGILFFWAAFFAVQSMGEEIICRGVLQRTWTRGLGITAGIIVPSVFFGIGHVGNNGFTQFALWNTILSGVLLSLLAVASRGLWLPGGLHAGWNFAQPLLGLNVSGRAIDFAVVQTRLHGSELSNGGLYGLEGSVPCAVLLLIACVLVALYWRRLQYRVAWAE